MIDVGSGFYIVKFDLSHDPEKVISWGLWMVFDHYLAVRPWVPYFVVSQVMINSTMMDTISIVRARVLQWKYITSSSDGGGYSDESGYEDGGCNTREVCESMYWNIFEQTNDWKGVV